MPDSDAPAHAYLGASPGCWALFSEVLEREFGEWRCPPVHRLTVDAYAVQHPGVEGRRSIRSVCGHLVSLCAVLEEGQSPRRATQTLRRFLRACADVRWLEPPAHLGQLTILDVVGATGLANHTRRVEAWARSVWDAWRHHHDTVREWLGRSSDASADPPSVRSMMRACRMPRPGR